MFTTLMNAVWGEFRGQAAKNLVERIAPFHRLEASPGYRAAAALCHDELKAMGFEPAIHTYPADGKSSFWSYVAGREWDAQSGTLHLIEPSAEQRKLADWHDLKMSLMPGSTDADVASAPLVAIPVGADDDTVRKLALKGAVVLTRNIAQARRIAIDELGALGILYDGFRRLRHVREEGDLTHLVHWAQLGDDHDHTPTFGFVVSPREGMHLRALCQQRASSQLPPPQVAAKVSASTYDGSYQVLSCDLPGRGRGMVLVVAHLCHPQWCANDNASGCAASIELLRTLKSLIDRGEIARPQRTIRIILVPEYAGSYIYLSQNPAVVKQAVAGINLDMVGENQDLCKTTFLFERPPAASASFVSDLGEAIQLALPQEGTTPSSTDRFPLRVRQAAVAFSGWSDHDVLSDPTVGIPAPMLIQWPDIYYHTTGDTIDKVDPESLRRAGSLGAIYCYFIANAGKREGEWLLAYQLGRIKERIVVACRQAAQTALNTGGAEGTRPRLKARIEHLRDLGERTLDSIRTVAPTLETEQAKNALRTFAARELRSALPALPTGSANRPGAAQRAIEAKAAAMLPQRLYQGPLDLNSQLRRLSRARRAEWQSFIRGRSCPTNPLRLTPRTAQFWADGSRTILQIANALKEDCGERDVEYLVRYFELLSELKLVRIKRL